MNRLIGMQSSREIMNSMKMKNGMPEGPKCNKPNL